MYIKWINAVISNDFYWFLLIISNDFTYWENINIKKSQVISLLPALLSRVYSLNLSVTEFGSEIISLGLQVFKYFGFANHPPWIQPRLWQIVRDLQSWRLSIWGWVCIPLSLIPISALILASTVIQPASLLLFPCNCLAAPPILK